MLAAVAMLAARADADPATTRAATQPMLKVGDRAPALNVDRWLKGEPVKAFQPGTIYVVEFWATWCGPCKQAIPDLTWLQKKYPQVVFIGVDVMEDDPSLVEPFVKQMGERMNYRVAADLSPADGEGGPVWRAWMDASGIAGIPCSFVIGADGKVADITSPWSLRSTLDALLAGKPLPATLNADESAKAIALWKQYHAAFKRKEWDAAERTLAAIVSAVPGVAEEQYRQSLRIARGDFAAAQAAFEEIDRRIAADDVEPSAIAFADHQRLEMLAKQGDAAAMNRLAAKAAKRVAGDADALNSLAWDLIGEPRGTGNHLPALDLDLALDIATQASDGAGGTDANILDTLARVRALRGEFDQAIALQEKAVAMNKAEGRRAAFEANLVQYRARQVK